MGGLMVRLCRWDSSKTLIPRSFQGSCVGSALFVGFCSDNVIFFFLSLFFFKTFTDNPEQGTRCTSLNVWDWRVTIALWVLWHLRHRGHKQKKKPGVYVVRVLVPSRLWEISQQCSSELNCSFKKWKVSPTPPPPASVPSVDMLLRTN